MARNQAFCECEVYQVCRDCDPETFERLTRELATPDAIRYERGKSMEDHGREVPGTPGAPPAPKMTEFTSGAKSTVIKPRYDLIPLQALTLLAERFGFGASRHGARNYRKGANDPKFLEDRKNHCFEHLVRYMEEGKRSDLAAVLCNAAMLADVGAFVDDDPFERDK